MQHKTAPQNVNLYQPVFRAEEKLFSATAICMSLGVLAVGLAVITVVTWWQVHRIERDLGGLRAQQSGHERLVADGNAMVEKAGSIVEHEARIRAMAVELERRERALRALDHSDGAMALGFAARVEALAHQHVAGLWLTGATFTTSPQGFAMTGSAVSADLVPMYLHDLASEAAFQGTRLDRLEIAHPSGAPPGRVDFVVSTSVALLPKDVHLAMSAVPGTP
jgi:hypothetical protein